MGTYIISILWDLQGALQNMSHIIKFVNNLCKRMLQKSYLTSCMCWPWAPLSHAMFSLSRLLASPSMAGQISASLFMLFHLKPIRILSRVVGSLRQNKIPKDTLYCICWIFGGDRKWRDLGLRIRRQIDSWECWEVLAALTWRCEGDWYCKASCIVVYVSVSAFLTMPWALLRNNLFVIL